MFNISTPLGWNGIKFVPLKKDPYLHHIETWDNPDQDWISIVLYWNRKFSEIPIDEKHPYQGAHYYMRLSDDEAFLLKEAIEKHLANRGYNGRDSQARKSES